MTQHRNGRRFKVPASRRLSWDLLAFHHNMPLCSHDRRMNLQIVADARKACPLRISWPALFLKAYGLTALEFPELRQTWYRWPWAHIYQHPSSVATLTVQRHLDGEPWLFWGHVRSPETLPLTEIQKSIDGFRHEDPDTIFAKQRQLARLPTLIRRLIWWWNLHVETKKRATRVGTFFLSTLAGLGAEIQLPPSVQTGCLTYGPLDENGVARVTLAYDHRLMDGALVAGILDQLEKTLNQTMAAELQSILTAAQGHRAA